MADSQSYHPEPYWSEVAEKIKNRGEQNVIAGDDEPYYRYKREKFLNMLKSLDFTDKKVLELGSGPGGNLWEISQLQPKELVGADISGSMIELAQTHLKDTAAKLVKIDGTTLPFEDRRFDLTFSATVLQHNSNEEMMQRILSEMCRVSQHYVVLFEKVGPRLRGDDLCVERPVSYYADLCRQNGFLLEETDYINIQISYYVSGIIRKGLNPASRKEGEPLNKLSINLQNITLPLTRVLDTVFPAKKDVAKMVFVRRDI